jgi:putative phage-type endonuclease
MTEQRTEQWFQDRLGHATGSRASDILAGKETQARKGYLTQLVTERLTGRAQDSFVNADMQRGIDVEPLAKAAYQASYELTDDVGFVKHPLIRWFGASPDALVGSDGLVEIKCPRSTTHLDYIQSGKPPAKYVHQMMAQLSCTGRRWVDFVSFDDRFPEHLRLFVVRFQPTEEEIENFESKVKEFLNDVNNLMEKLCPSHTK